MPARKIRPGDKASLSLREKKERAGFTRMPTVWVAENRRSSAGRPPEAVCRKRDDPA
jgi:hypothetical protein